jgi:hypothetical protein
MGLGKTWSMVSDDTRERFQQVCNNHPLTATSRRALTSVDVLCELHAVRAFSGIIENQRSSLSSTIDSKSSAEAAVSRLRDIHRCMGRRLFSGTGSSV